MSNELAWATLFVVIATIVIFSVAYMRALMDLHNIRKKEYKDWKQQVWHESETMIAQALDKPDYKLGDDYETLYGYPESTGNLGNPDND